MWIDDDLLARHAEPLALATWVPSTPLVVLGASNAAEREVELARCHEAGVPVLKRYGGGGTVLLHGGCVIVSVGLWVKQLYQNKFYFEQLNAAVIRALAAGWPQLAALGQRGLSDITHGERKVAGTSLFRSRNYLLYQASLLVAAERTQIAHFLKHPSREPDYRQGRGHGAFLVGLDEIVAGLTPAAVERQCRETLPGIIMALLTDELLPPQPEQFAALRARMARAAASAEGN